MSIAVYDVFVCLVNSSSTVLPLTTVLYVLLSQVDAQ